MTDLALRLDCVSKKFKGFALREVSFELPRGYIMGLIGANGAGKTTLIKMIMNVVRSDGGTIRVCGSDGDTTAEAVRSRIGFVQDEPTFYGHLSLARMKSIIAGFYPRWNERVFRQLIARFRLPLEKRINNLSRGMTTKFALSLALSHDADPIILDEPTAGLDPGSRRELLTILAEYIEDGSRSVLFSTHITSDVERVADFVTLLQQGRVVFSSNKDEIMENWALVKGDNELLSGPLCAQLVGWRVGAHGFEGLTSRAGDVKRHSAGQVHIERATLEDILYYTAARGGGPTCSR